MDSHYFSEKIRGLAVALLGQKRSILEYINPEDYTKPCQSIFNASVGSHIRHSLNHYQSLLSAIESNSTINYDDRQRNTVIEVDKFAAISELDIIQAKITTLKLDNEVSMEFYGDASINFDPYSVHSNVGRELSFVTHHAVHHLAMIKLIMNTMSYTTSGQIGIAMSTLKSLRNPINEHCPTGK